MLYLRGDTVIMVAPDLRNISQKKKEFKSFLRKAKEIIKRHSGQKHQIKNKKNS